jgi:hypothetical protein
MIKSELLSYLNVFSLCVLILLSYHDWKVFFINLVLCTSGMFFVPVSVQQELPLSLGTDHFWFHHPLGECIRMIMCILQGYVGFG